MLLSGASGCAGAFTSDEAKPLEPIRFAVDGSKSHPISRYVYGLNFRHQDSFGSHDWSITTLNRLGGNRLTAYNWVTNDSNCGADCGDEFPNDGYLRYGLARPDVPASFVTEALVRTFESGEAGAVVTVPIAGHVAADRSGSTLPLPVAKSPREPAVPGPRFRRSEPRNPAGARESPDPAAGVVYQDDFVRWIERRHPEAKRNPLSPIFYQLDNEPDLWGSTHPEIRGVTAAGEPVLLGWDELVAKTVDHAAAIKDVAPRAKVLSPPLANWFGFWGLGHKTRPAGYEWYVDYYLERLKQAGAERGQRLVDVLAVHWYPEAQNECRKGEQGCWPARVTHEWQPQLPSVLDARVQAPRSLWDPGFTERSWVSENVPGCLARGCPVELLPRLKRSIAAHYPGTELAITEYYFGRGGDISGGLAQADALGIFGREGLFAAALWPAAGVYAWNEPEGACDGDASCATLAYRCVHAAFRAFLDYDGKGGRFGDTSLAAETSHVAESSVYASASLGRPDRLVAIALNKTAVERQAEFSFANAGPFASAEVYRVTGGVGACEGPTRQGDLPLSSGAPARVTLPAMSIGVYVFRR